MGAWGTGISSNDIYADIYGEFFELYNDGLDVVQITKKLIADNQEILNDKDDCNNFWFALAKAQWECKQLDKDILDRVKKVIETGADLEVWRQLDADEKEIKKRKVVLDKFLADLETERPKAKSRKKKIIRQPVFEKGDCLTFKLENGNFGGAVVLATDNNPKTAYNLVATTRLNQSNKPTLKDFENAEVLICNFGQWQDKADITWYMPDLFYKDYAYIYENIGKISVDLEYDTKNHDGKGYLFQPSWTAGWSMNNAAERQFESELTKQKPTQTLTIKQLTKKEKWWKVL